MKAKHICVHSISAALFAASSCALAAEGETDVLKDVQGWHRTISGAATPEMANAQASTHLIKRLTNETGLIFAVSPDDATVASAKLNAAQAANAKAALSAMDASQKVAAFGRILVYSVHEEAGELVVYNIPVGRDDVQSILAGERVKAEMAGNGKGGPVLRGMLAGEADAIREGLANTGPVLERDDAPVAVIPDTRTDAQKKTNEVMEQAKPLARVAEIAKYPLSILSSRRAEPPPPDYADLYKKFLAEEERTGKSIEQPR